MRWQSTSWGKWPRGTSSAAARRVSGLPTDTADLVVLDDDTPVTTEQGVYVDVDYEDEGGEGT